MARNPQHQMLVRPLQDEAARKHYVLALKSYLGRSLRPANQTVFERRAKPAFTQRHGRPPETQSEISEAMYADSRYQAWCALSRCAQEMMWDSVAEPIERDRAGLSERYRERAGAADRRGSLDLDPEFEVPKAIRRIPIHLQPGGYAKDEGEDDVVAGALYEHGGNLYSMGQNVGTRESKAECIMRFIGKRYPDFAPTRILDIGCSAGSSSTPYALAYPKAEVHAIDVGAGMLRYAHARAEALGAPVHFHQRDAAATGFADQYFDLVVSHNAMHEMSQRTTRAMYQESWRLLEPGGICIHQDVPLRFSDMDQFMQFERSWDQYNNNEPFWVGYAKNDCEAMLLEAGFPKDAIFVGRVPQLDHTISWFVAAGRKPD